MTRKERQHARGYFLIEAMAAVAIVAVALTGFLISSQQALYSRIRSNELTVATLLAQQKLGELETKFLDPGEPFQQDSDKGEFEGYPGYRWSYTTEDWDPTELIYASLPELEGVEAEAREPDEQISLKDIYKRLDLTVSWPAGKGEQRVLFSTIVAPEGINIDEGGTDLTGSGPGHGERILTARRLNDR